MANIDIATELQRIQQANGGILRAVDVVREARDPASPLHHQFTWDDGEAAEQWRLHEARNLIRVVVSYFPADENVREIRTYVSMMDDRQVPGGGYRVMVEMIGSPQHRARLLAQALIELRRIQQKYREVTELAAIFDAISQMHQQAGHFMPPASPPASGPQAPI